jgi:acetyltransferase-like isoleucine patch superfamily enzyme
MPAVNLGGGVHLEEGVYIGTNATILPGVKVGAWSVIGAGAVVTRDVPPHETWVGVPAKRIEK